MKFEKIEKGMTLYEVKHTKGDNYSVPYVPPRRVVRRVEIAEVSDLRVVGVCAGKEVSYSHRETHSLHKHPPEWASTPDDDKPHCLICGVHVGGYNAISSLHAEDCEHPAAVLLRTNTSPEVAAWRAELRHKRERRHECEVDRKKAGT